MRYALIALFVLLWLGLARVWPVPGWLWLVYLGMSAVCMAAYAADKAAAMRGRRRVPERQLLLLGLVGGWPGALLAQQWLRHKSAKASFRSAFAASVVLNVMVFIAIATPAMRTLLLRVHL